MDDVPQSYSPAYEMRMRVIDFGIDKYGLNAYIYDSTNDGATNYDRVLLSTSKSGSDSVGDLEQGEWADVKVTVQGGALAGKTAAFLTKVERLTPDLSEVRLFHTSVTRAIATWPNWHGEPGFTGTFEDYVAAEFPSSQAGDFAVLEAGIVSEETYVEQGLYWELSYHPLIEYVLETYAARPGAGRLPGHRRVPAPVPRPGHRDAAQRRGQPGVRRRPGQRHAGRPGRRARGLHPARLSSAPTRRCAWPRT